MRGCHARRHEASACTILTQEMRECVKPKVKHEPARRRDATPESHTKLLGTCECVQKQTGHGGCEESPAWGSGSLQACPFQKLPNPRAPPEAPRPPTASLSPKFAPDGLDPQFLTSLHPTHSGREAQSAGGEERGGHKAETCTSRGRGGGGKKRGRGRKRGKGKWRGERQATWAGYTCTKAAAKCARAAEVAVPRELLHKTGSDTPLKMPHRAAGGEGCTAGEYFDHEAMTTRLCTRL